MHRHCICTVLLPWHPDLACFGLSTRGQCDSRTTEVKSVFCCQHNHVWNPEIPKVWSEADWKEELEGFPAAVRECGEWVEVLEEDVLSVSECCSNALQQEVERLNGNELSLSLFLIPVFTTGAQRETQVKLPHKNTVTHYTVYSEKLFVINIPCCSMVTGFGNWPWWARCGSTRTGWWVTCLSLNYDSTQSSDNSMSFSNNSTYSTTHTSTDQIH